MNDHPVRLWKPAMLAFERLAWSAEVIGPPPLSDA